MRILKFSCQDMWSFGELPVDLDLSAQHNVLIGKNNAGKSKVLAALKWVKNNAQSVIQNQAIPIEAEMFHEPHGERPLHPQFRLTLDISTIRTQLVAGAKSSAGNQELVSAVDDQIGDVAVVSVTSLDQSQLTVRASIHSPDRPSFDIAKYAPHADGQFRQALRGHWEGVVRTNFLHRTVGTFLAPKIKYIGGWRALDEKVDQNGTIVDCLHVWREPPQKQKHLRHLFTRIQDTFRDLMLNDDLHLRPEHSGKNLAIGSGGTYLPIDAYGDGVHHLLIVAFHLVTAPDSILLIEEPETHLHPELQRNLMRVIRRDLKGQSFITTHSPVLLDAAASGRVFRVERNNGISTVTCCNTSVELLRTLDTLDVRASDLLQANLVIWVEGPTDRMFIKKCFELRGEALTEGVHYQFAYYGGRLRSHFTFDQQSAEELVNLLKLSRHVAMVCDSDKTEEIETIDASKERLKKECEAVGGFYWVTDGREIENYFPDEVLTAAYRELMEDQTASVSITQFQKIDKALSTAFPGDPAHGDGWKVNYEDNKARVMPHLLKHLKKEHLVRWGLNERLDGLVSRIRQANPN